MRYFRRLKQGYDPAPLLAEFASMEGASVEHAFQRGDAPEGRAIPLRGLVKSAQGGRARRDVHESRWTSRSYQLPRFQEFLKQVAAEEEGVLGRAGIIALGAGQQTGARAHQGEYFKLRNRYQLILKAASGCWLTAGDEDVPIHEGELWWFDNKAIHAARNESGDDSIQLAFDLLPRQLETQVMRASRKARKASLEA